MHWIDIVFIAIILIFAIVGLVKGLFDSILSLCASVASVFLSFWAGKPVAAFLNRIVDVNGFFVKGLTSIGVTDTSVPNYNLDQLATICTIALSMVVVFILIKVAVWLLAKLFDSVSASSTAISGLNRLFGLVFGAVQGFAIVLVCLGVTSIVSMVGPLDAKINTFLEPSKLTRGTYNYVDEWVQDELSDRIEEFVQDLSKTDLTPEIQVTNYAQQVADALDGVADILVAGSQTTTGFTIDTSITKTVENVTVEITQDLEVAIKYYEVVVGGDNAVVTPTIANQDGGLVVVSGLNANTTYLVEIQLKLNDGTHTVIKAVSFQVTTLAEAQPQG